ncbi:hypothetical protein J25TS5_54340 [Paenibacillus faecis]|uniref:class I SAM-dependent methyltransferase n=1 Tax=Paenibacillus faecis TaxID=862114 RepID=UPI001B020F78|nr:class I SAM-dependent methyltransferase [Paenibacillus faecis]GIO88502.1 hypothetical protein J25TS5_54340 [Paenibacillus faecis]
MINTLFDQYQRYNNARKIIDGLRLNNETFRILEVGANEHRNLEKFLPMDSITYLDIQLPEELIGEPNYILGDATNMSFPDGEYDIVVALDVFEHIPPEKREQFIDELHRVSSMLCIITAPFHSRQIVEAESRVNTVFKSLFNKDFIWLKEHMENGLPNKDSLINFLNERKINFRMLEHGKIDIWERLMGIHFFAARNPILGYYREEIDKFYNANIFDYDYSSNDSYRMVLILEKNRKCPVINSESDEIPLVHLQKLENLERQFYQLNSLLSSNEHISKSTVVKDKVQVYIDSGQGFSESESKSFHVNETSTYISISLQEYQKINSIRIDPSDYSGVYKIEISKLIGVSSEEAIPYQMKGNFLGVFREFSDIYYFDKDDPNVTLELDSNLKISRLELRVTKLSFEHIVVEIDSFLQTKSNIFTSLNENFNQQTKENEALQWKIEQLNAEIKELSLKMSSISGEKDALAKAFHNIENENIDLQQQLRSKERELTSIYESRAWNLVVKLRKLLGK